MRKWQINHHNTQTHSGGVYAAKAGFTMFLSLALPLATIGLWVESTTWDWKNIPVIPPEVISFFTSGYWQWLWSIAAITCLVLLGFGGKYEHILKHNPGHKPNNREKQIFLFFSRCHYVLIVMIIVCIVAKFSLTHLPITQQLFVDINLHFVMDFLGVNSIHKSTTI